MPLKPVHLRSAGSQPQGRQAVWEAIRRLGSFTIRDLRGELNAENQMHPGSIRPYVQGLANAGFLAEVTDQGVGTWALVRDVGVEAPRVRRDGSEVTHGRAREQLWRTMKVLGAFTVRELAVAASTEACRVDVTDAKSYVGYLKKAGYLVEVAERASNQPARYRLLPSRNTGPKAPMVQRVHQVFDPNLGQVVWPVAGGAR